MTVWVFLSIHSNCYYIANNISDIDTINLILNRFKLVKKINNWKIDSDNDSRIKLMVLGWLVGFYGISIIVGYLSQ